METTFEEEEYEKAERQYNKLIQSEMKKVEKTSEGINNFTEEEIDKAAKNFDNMINPYYGNQDIGMITTYSDWEIFGDNIAIVTSGVMYEGGDHGGADLYVLKQKKLIFLYRLYLAMKNIHFPLDEFFDYDDKPELFSDYAEKYIKDI